MWNDIPPNLLDLQRRAAEIRSLKAEIALDWADGYCVDHLLDRLHQLTNSRRTHHAP
jgi:predicted metalloenzyme YecM